MTGELKSHGAAILCGGQSRRMGFDKALALRNRDGRPLLAFLAGELAGRFGEVILVTNDLDKLSGRAELKAYRRAADLHPGAGPAGAIHTALAACPGRALFVMACDLPVIDWPVIDRMRALMDERGADVVVPRHGELREPLYAFYGPGSEPVFRAGLAGGLRKIWAFYPGLKTVYLDLNERDLASGFLDNLNTPADLRRAGLPLPGREYE